MAGDNCGLTKATRGEQKMQRISKRRMLICVLLIHLFVAIPFLCWSRPAPYYQLYGDVYRGWPFPFGLDQGDVGGIPILRLAYFSWINFLADIVASIFCGLPLSFLAVWVDGRRLNGGKSK